MVLAGVETPETNSIADKINQQAHESNIKDLTIKFGEGSENKEGEIKREYWNVVRELEDVAIPSCRVNIPVRAYKTAKDNLTERYGSKRYLERTV